MDETTENFPVAARFLAPEKRSAVLAFYRAARAADDIADDPTLSSEEKIARLDALSDAQASPHFAHLLQAFRQDATKRRYRDWSDLMLYCRFSAMPVGRFLLDLHGEGPEARSASDALCAALQVLNHLQDCGDDFRRLDRVYLPQTWIEDVNALGLDRTSPALRATFERVLDRVDELMLQARPLGRLVADRRLALQAQITVAVAERLARKLRRHDPLAGHVRLSKPGYALATLVATIRWLLRR